jgi:hypothetical protein
MGSIFESVESLLKDDTGIIKELFRLKRGVSRGNIGSMRFPNKERWPCVGINHNKYEINE